MPSDRCCLSDYLTYTLATQQHRYVEQMIESGASYQNYAAGERARVDDDRLPPGPALLVTVGLSLLAWGFVLVPLVAILHQ